MPKKSFVVRSHEDDGQDDAGRDSILQSRQLEKMRALAPALPRVQLVERGDLAGKIEGGLKGIASYAIGVAHILFSD